MSEQYTLDEMRDLFIDHIHELIEYWEKEERTPDLKGKLEGLAFSILTTIDGASMALPGYKLIPITCQEDKEYAIEKGEKYYPTDVDIAGALHEQFYKNR